MSDETNEELDNGRLLAIDLAKHLIEMGAASMTIPVFIADEKYQVTVEHIPVG